MQAENVVFRSSSPRERHGLRGGVLGAGRANQVETAGEALPVEAEAVGRAGRERAVVEHLHPPS